MFKTIFLVPCVRTAWLCMYTGFSVKEIKKIWTQPFTPLPMSYFAPQETIVEGNQLLKLKKLWTTALQNSTNVYDSFVWQKSSKVPPSIKKNYQFCYLDENSQVFSKTWQMFGKIPQFAAGKMLFDTSAGNDKITKKPSNQVILINGPATVGLVSDIKNVKITDSLQDLHLKGQDECDNTDSTTALCGSFMPNDYQHTSCYSESDEENQNKSSTEIRNKCVEDERKWLRYKVDSVTKEQAIIFCILGQLILSPEDIHGSRKEVPSPEDAKQILLYMTYGDHWLLSALYHVMGYYDKVNNLLMYLGSDVDLTTSNRSYLEALIINQFCVPKADTFDLTDS